MLTKLKPILLTFGVGLLTVAIAFLVAYPVVDFVKDKFHWSWFKALMYIKLGFIGVWLVGKEVLGTIRGEE